MLAAQHHLEDMEALAEAGLDIVDLIRLLSRDEAIHSPGDDQGGAESDGEDDGEQEEAGLALHRQGPIEEGRALFAAFVGISLSDWTLSIVPTRIGSMSPSSMWYWTSDWIWGAPLIIATVVVHVLGLGLIDQRVTRVLSSPMRPRRF